MNKIDVNRINKIGYIDLNIDDKIDFAAEIENLKKEKNAIILAHFYQTAEVQDIADFIGDSLALAQKAESIESRIVVMAGVKFMAETIKILSPQKKVLLPDLSALCSLADSCDYEKFRSFIADFPDYKVVTYVNTNALVKTLSYICCTSSNAVQIVNSLNTDKIIFAPDRNLGNYIKSLTGKSNMIIWDGACHVHKKFSLEKLLEMKNAHKDAKVISHPECDRVILLNSDFVGSTSQLLDYTSKSTCIKFIVGTEPGVIHQMRKANPSKIFLPIPPDDAVCACNECNFMRLITLKKIYLTLKYEFPEITLDNIILNKAYIPIKRMIDVSVNL